MPMALLSDFDILLHAIRTFDDWRHEDDLRLLVVVG